MNNHFEVENQIRLAQTMMDSAITGAPLARWQRKRLETSTSSVNNSLNASLHLNCAIDSMNNLSLNISTNNTNQIINGSKTPNKTPTNRATPNRTPAHTLKQCNSTNKCKTPKTPCNGADRFIPNRNAMNADISHYLIMNSKENDCQDTDPNTQSNSNQAAISENLVGDLSNFRIMCYQNKAPIAAEGQSNNLKVLYSSSKCSSSTKKSQRYIPTQPERILDAPDVKNDYYLQLIDWNASNILAVALMREIYLWNANTGDITNLMTLDEEQYIASVSWIEEGNHLAIGTSEGDIQLWDTDRVKRLRTMKTGSGRVGSMSWNSYIISGGTKTGNIYNNDVRVANHLVSNYNGHNQEVCGLKWSPGGQYLASGGNDNTIQIWSNNMSSNSDNKPVFTFTEHQAAVKALAWCPWRPSCLASGGGTADRTIRIWNCQNGTNLYTVDAKSQVSSILWSKDYKELISSHGYSNNELIIWKYPGLAKVAELTGHTARVLGLVMSPDGSTVASVGADETLRFWECFQIDPQKKKKVNYGTNTKLIDNSLRLTIR
ncbi:cell division cycle protein 20 homolog [Oppia nitens]|uniref:cell division cycle protein 20 homolog n=1 Tax=Oppia nitens TaxID=1686743 RepID=UPI0023DCCD29|nr:cell division cycle protein 20 homolog [Oppia nitens]